MKDSLGDRMKTYEDVNRNFLTKRIPVIIRIDGCHFHSYTKGLEKPFDEQLNFIFWEVCKYLTQNIMGCKMAYHQSDEISLLITNYDKLTTESWFNNNIQKIASVSASLATAKFNQLASEIFPLKPLATFDSRVFVLPHDEVCNYLLWRQNDASKNSVSMVAQSQFSHNSLQGLNGKEMQKKLLEEKDINWNSLPVWQKRGVCVIKRQLDSNRSEWFVDEDIPIFSQDRKYIDRYVYIEQEYNVEKEKQNGDY